MATTTTNYGFDIPQSTDLVKDGATAIATLGQDIDTAMNTALGTKKAGMVLLNTTSFSAVASTNVTNCFSATYTHYRINLNLIGTGATERDLSFRYLVGTTPNTATNYRQQEFVATGTSSFPSRTTGLTSHRAARCSNATRFGSILDIFFPFQTERTQAISFQIGAPTGNIEMVNQFCELDVTTSYDGIQFFPSGDNITGSISVYGYNA
jgi:hypothetical protein